MLLLFASVYYTVENLCVRRRKLFDKRQSLPEEALGEGGNEANFNKQADNSLKGG